MRMESAQETVVALVTEEGLWPGGGWNAFAKGGNGNRGVYAATQYVKVAISRNVFINSADAIRFRDDIKPPLSEGDATNFNLAVGLAGALIHDELLFVLDELHEQRMNAHAQIEGGAQ